MNLLKKIFTDEGTAYVGLCRFKNSKVSVPVENCSLKFTMRAKNYYQTNFTPNILL